MPIYEFYSPDSHRIYSFLAKRFLKEGEVPICPDGPKNRMEKVVSAFAFTGKAKEVVKKEGESGAEMDPRMEREMMKMADEFSKMDERNPDPRMLGKMMRRMMEATGQKLPGEMGEMLQRLEKGEDWKMRLRRRVPPRRDPKLYELEDYVRGKKSVRKGRQKA